METRHPVEGSFGRDFPTICNHCVVMAAWSRKKLKFSKKFLRCKKTTHYGNFFKTLFRKVFTASPIDVVVFKFHEIWPMGNRWNFALFTGREKNKISPASQTVATVRIAPKICQNQPATMSSECSRFHPNLFTFDGVIAERVNTAKLPGRVNPIFERSLFSSRVIKTH